MYKYVLFPLSEGMFTALVRGIYHFTFTAFDWDVTGGSLTKNGQKIVSWYDNGKGSANPSSNSATLMLEVGEQVNVMLWKGLQISDNVNHYSSFSGFLLFPMKENVIR